MTIGLCGAEFPDVRDLLAAARDRGIPVRNAREADGGDETAVAQALAARFAASARAVIG
ncbi:MAG TPA: hypothetical protein VGG75_10415 [Trebonia sp.]|jgi:hypothetical protein